MGASTRIDLLCVVFSECPSSSGEIAKIQRQALAGAVSGKIGLPERARINAKASVDVLKAVNVGRFGRNIRSPQVHVPPSLADTCQLCPVSRKAGRSDYKGSKAAANN